MRTFWSKVIVIALFVPSSPFRNITQAQVSDPTPDRTVGAAEVYYFKDKNKTRAQVRIYLQGKPEDIGAKKDALSMDVIFEVTGQKVTKPQQASIAFSVYSADKSKYSKDHDLHIYTEGMEGKNGAQWRTRLLSTRPLPSGGSLEIFLSPPLEYDRIFRMANAIITVITLGESRFALKENAFQALKDLNQTIEK